MKIWIWIIKLSSIIYICGALKIQKMNFVHRKSLIFQYMIKFNKYMYNLNIKHWIFLIYSKFWNMNMNIKLLVYYMYIYNVPYYIHITYFTHDLLVYTYVYVYIIHIL
jgi:hypothetical protein